MNLWNTAKPPANLEILLDVKVKLTVELGACQMPMRDVLKLNPGSVVKLDKTAQAPVDLFANQKRIARGEIVVVDDSYGIKITELLGPPPREPKFFMGRLRLAFGISARGPVGLVCSGRRDARLRPDRAGNQFTAATAATGRRVAGCRLVCAPRVRARWPWSSRFFSAASGFSKTGSGSTVKKGGAPRLNVLEVKSLGQRQAIYVVGYEQQRMLLASSPAGVTLFSHLPTAEDEETVAPTPLRA